MCGLSGDILSRTAPNWAASFSVRDSGTSGAVHSRIASRWQALRCLPWQKNCIQKVFYGCKKLKTLTILTKKLNKTNVGDQAFSGIKSKAKVYCHPSMVKDYKTLLVSKGVPQTAVFKKIKWAEERTSLHAGKRNIPANHYHDQTGGQKPAGFYQVPFFFCLNSRKEANSFRIIRLLLSSFCCCLW